MNQNKEKQHQFRQGIDIGQAVSGIGEVSIQSIRHKVEDADENYQAGVQELKKYEMPAMDAAAIFSAKELSKGIRAELNQITITGGQVYDLIREGALSMVDLSDQKALKERLESMEDLTSFQKKQICKFRETAYDAMVVKDAIEKQKTVLDVLEEPLKAHLKSREFFDLKQQKTNELLKVYFQTSQNDVLKNVNPVAMSEKKIQKLLRTRERNGFSETDIAAIRLAKRQMKYRESRIHAGRLLNIRKRVEMLRTYSCRVDGTAGTGLVHLANTVQVVHAAYAVGKFGLKAGVVTASFLGKYTGAEYLIHKVNQIRKDKTELLKRKAQEAVKDSKMYQAAAERADILKSKTTAASEKVNHKMEQNAGVQKYKQMQEKVKERAKAAAKKVNQTKAAARSAGRKVRQGTDIVLSPVRLVGKGINGVRSFFSKMHLILLSGAGVVFAVFLILVVLINAVLAMFQTESNAALSAILTEDESFISDITAILLEKTEDKRQEAEAIANGIPKNPAVLEGHTISKYGYPDGNGTWTDGSRIIYLDGNGNVILNGMNNIKDCIVMAYVIMDGDFDSNPRARNDLILDLWELMNPEVTYKESDIYTCPYGCDSFAYVCNSSDDYTMIDTYQTDGVTFYGDSREYSEHGDSYTVTCNGCKDEDNSTFYHDTQTGTGKARAAAGCTNYSVSYTCSGHFVTVCYGHKDVEVYVTVASMEEMFESGMLPASAGKTYQSYISDFSGWSEDNQEWAKLLADCDWFELYGIDPTGGMGYVAGSGMTSEEIAAIIDTYGNLDATRTAICSDAMSFVGQIPYYWGGKASTKDYAANGFNTTVAPDYKGRNKKGLDCSGFVQWIIWRVTDVKLGVSTSTITAGMQPISASELQPGDLGLMAVPGSASNHVGIFVGYNESGQALWCHENSGAGNVSVNNTTCFKYYYRIF